MRPNASILAVLALAATSLLPLTAHALPHFKKSKSTHGKLSPAARQGLKEHKAHLAEAHHARTHKTSLTLPANRATVERVHAFVQAQDTPDRAGVGDHAHAEQSKTVQHGRRHRHSPAEQAPNATPRKATSADFLASAHVAASGPEESSAVTGQDFGPAGESEGAQHDVEARLDPAPAPRASQRAALEAALAPAQVAASQPPIATLDAVVPTPIAMHALYNRRGRLIMPAPLKGSHEILLRQNQVADSEGLDRIRDDSDLERMRAEHLLVSIPTGNGLHIDDRLPTNRRYCRPWTALFLDQLGREYYARFQKPLQVNSAARTVEFQHHLIHVNGNAAPADGDTASPHLTGQAVDLAKHGLSLTEIAWLRGYLLPLVQQGKVDVEEEFQQSCFHISVYQKFLPHEPSMRRSIAANHRAGAAVLASALP